LLKVSTESVDSGYSFIYPILTLVRTGETMLTLKLTTIGNSLGVVLPKEALAKLNLEKGDILFLTESPDGFRLTPYSPEFETQMLAARKIMKKRRAVLRELAK
jgi:putative addiction module antidote